MNNKVTMLVWNHFTNDARVLRSVGTLAEAGNQVLLIAIQPSKPQSLLPQNDINNLTVTRVKGTLPILGQLNQLKKSILAFVLASILLVIGYYSIPVVGLSLILLLFLYEKKTLASYRVYLLANDFSRFKSTR
ncbi:hypothetical protein [Brochothrix campestris]|uniref:hypothetical protein n=1 Tax=Brochothrix campestris TaxID=2757 RepID=UPI0026A3FB62